MSSCRDSPLPGVTIQFAHRQLKLASDILHISLVHSHLPEQLDLENRAVPLKLHNTTRAKDHQRFWQPVWINSFHMLRTRAYKITETSTLEGRKKNLWSCVHWTAALLFICVQPSDKGWVGFFMCFQYSPRVALHQSGATGRCLLMLNDLWTSPSTLIYIIFYLMKSRWG